MNESSEEILHPTCTPSMTCGLFTAYPVQVVEEDDNKDQSITGNVADKINKSKEPMTEKERKHFMTKMLSKTNSEMISSSSETVDKLGLEQLEAETIIIRRREEELRKRRMADDIRKGEESDALKKAAELKKKQDK